MADSFIVSQVSDVLSWSGIRSLEIKSAFEIRVPQRMPHVSRFFLVFDDALRKNSVRSVGGMKTVRRGVPFSRKAVGLKV